MQNFEPNIPYYFCLAVAPKTSLVQSLVGPVRVRALYDGGAHGTDGS